MLVQPFMTKFNNIGEQVFLRCDPKYRHFWDNKKGLSIEHKDLVNIRLKDILIPFAKTVIKKGELDEERPILELNDIESRTSLILQERVVTEVGSDKLDFSDCNLVFNRLEPYLGKIIINDRSKRYIGTTEWVPLKLDEKRVRALFLKYLLLLPQFLHSFALLKSGKRHARIAHIDFHNIFIPLLSNEQQAEIERKLVLIEKRMIVLHGSLSKPVDIINRVFAREFGYSLQEYEKRAKQNTYQKTFTNLDKAFLLRSSVKFQHPKYDYLNEILHHRPWLRLKSLCAEPIHRGIQPEYDNNGEVLVVKTINLKNECLDFSETERVTQEFFEANREAEIKENDILVSSTGEGRGKVDIYDLEEPAIGDTHISIVRLNANVNPYYVLYFMRSLLGKLQLETLEMAIKGTPEIYWYQLEQMRIIDLPQKKQDVIVEEVRTELQELQRQKAEIQRLRDQIDEIFMQAIMKEAKE